MLIIKYLWGRVLLNTHDRLRYLTWVRFHFPSSYCQLSSIHRWIFTGRKSTYPSPSKIFCGTIFRIHGKQMLLSMYPRGQHRLSMGGQRCQSTTVATKSASVRFWWNIRRMRQAAVVAESEEKSTGIMEMRRDSQKTAMIDLTKRKNLLVRKTLFFIHLFYSRTDFSKVLIWWTAYRSNLKMIAKRYKIFSNLILDLSWKLLSLFFFGMERTWLFRKW